jgi:nicotinamidase-related amidase
MKAAMMIIDMQKAFYKGKSKKSMDAAVEYIEAAIDIFRENDMPIIWTQDKDSVVPGDEGFEIIESLTPKENDYRIIKEYGNSFNKTDAHKILIEEAVDTVIITGYRAEHCVLSTYREALDLDLVPIILRGSIASEKSENINFVESISDIISYNVLKRIFEEKK